LLLIFFDTFLYHDVGLLPIDVGRLASDAACEAREEPPGGEAIARADVRRRAAKERGDGAAPASPTRYTPRAEA
jgi:hypothetical protein